AINDAHNFVVASSNTQDPNHHYANAYFFSWDTAQDLSGEVILSQGLIDGGHDPRVVMTGDYSFVATYWSPGDAGAMSYARSYIEWFDFNPETLEINGHDRQQLLGDVGTTVSSIPVLNQQDQVLDVILTNNPRFTNDYTISLQRFDGTTSMDNTPILLVSHNQGYMFASGTSTDALSNIHLSWTVANPSGDHEPYTQTFTQ